MSGFCKATQISGLYDCQLEEIIACLYGPGQKGKTKIEILQMPCGKQGEQRDE